MCACRKENAGKKDTECQGKPLAIFIVRIMLQEWARRGRRPRRRRRRCCAKATRANVSAYKNSHFNICQLAALAADLPHAAPRIPRHAPPAHSSGARLNSAAREFWERDGLGQDETGRACLPAILSVPNSWRWRWRCLRCRRHRVLTFASEPPFNCN